MILIEDTHWPLVVVGVCCGPRLEEACLDRGRLRWRSREPRRAMFVVPGSGQCALYAHARLTRWLTRQSLAVAFCRTAVWVVPDDAVRSSVALMLDLDSDLSFGGPVATFATVTAAFRWMGDMVRVEESALSAPGETVSNCYPAP
jgi:hypothetical protein